MSADPSPDARSVPVVHAVTTPELVAASGFVALAGRVMAALGPRGALQLRDHTAAGGRLLALARELVPIQDATGCRLVVNERLDVVLAGGAWGVQLTSRSLAPADARLVAPRLPIGASVHAADEAREAADGGADWVVAGHVFRTASHPGEPGRGSGFLRAVVEAAPDVPVIAIGGVTPADVPGLRAAGAHGVAVIRGIWDAADPAEAATDYLAWYDAHVP
ncbi:MAG TPA: thiamine phosphate synthase [Gemmatimonadales bacterium]